MKRGDIVGFCVAISYDLTNFKSTTNQTMPNRFRNSTQMLLPILILMGTILSMPFCSALDSLQYYQQQLKAMPPSQVSFHFMQMARHAKNREQKKAFYYSAIDAAKENGTSDTLCLRLVQIAWMAYGDRDYSLASHFLDQALLGKLCQLSPQMRGEVLYCQGLCSYRTGDYQLALMRLRGAAQQFVNVKGYAAAIKVLAECSDVYLVQGNHHYAVESLKEAHALAFNHNVALWAGTVCLKLSQLLDDLQQYGEAMRYASMAMDVAQLQDTATRQVTFSRMGDLYLKLNQPLNASRFFNQAILLTRDSLSIYAMLGKQAKADLMQGNLSQALSKAERNLKFATTIADTLLKVKALCVVGDILFEQQKYGQAIAYGEQALALVGESACPQLQVTIMIQLANSYSALGDYERAAVFFERSKVICDAHRLPYELAMVYNGLSALSEKQFDYRQALAHQRQSGMLRDSLFNESLINQMAKIEMKMQALKEQDFIQSLQHENAFITHSMEQERNKQFIFMAISVVLFFISMIAIRLGYSNYRSHKKLKQKNKELAQLNATKDKFFSIIAHDLKAPFNSLLGFSEVLTLHAENKSTREIVEYSGLVYSAARKLYHLVENLLQWSRAQLGSVPYKPECLHIATQTSNVVSLLKMNAESKDIVLTQRIHSDIVAYGDANHYNTILRNLLSNAIKFSKVGSVISIGAEMEPDRVKVWVSDSGMGIHEDQMKRLFSINQTASENGTLNEKGSGLGLLICKEFVELNKGEIWVESQLGKGSVFIFTLPLSFN